MEQTFILPGFSLKNRAWALETKKALKIEDRFCEVINYRHWETRNPANFHADSEAEKILNKIENKKYNIIAKSIGTLIAMKVILHSPTLLNKLILCGIPINDLDEKSLDNYKILHEIADNKLLIFQNSEDPHGNYIQVKQFLAKFGNFYITQRESSDHDYPLFTEFHHFLHFSEV
jgi:hypothetical protein